VKYVRRRAGLRFEQSDRRGSIAECGDTRAAALHRNDWGSGMFSAVRRHLSYANVVATMALVFAMGGGAMAATHYLITSTSQISPKVLKALEAKIASKIAPGAPGREGAAGKEGAAGNVGAAGKEGPAGTEGKPGTGLSKLSEGEQEELKKILPFVSYTASGVGGKPTIRFSGVNVQVLSGAGEEKALNGKGNLIVGYDEEPGAQGGSNNLVIGSIGQTYGSYAAILGGEHNGAEGPYSDVFGSYNETEETAKAASVSGGHENRAAGEWSSISGGYGNVTGKGGTGASVSGGLENRATGVQASVAGGELNDAEVRYASISGGRENTAAGEYSSILGGKQNEAAGQWSSVSGGLENTTGTSGIGATVGGGAKNAAEENEASVGAGFENKATGSYSSVFGGKELTVAGEYGAMP
jgi:hypothetical protein